jgi:4-hydroxy-2-oxoglutarate aldolase
MLTPFKENGEVDYDAFARNIERWNKTELSGYLVLGSNSETAYLNEEEKLKLIELTVKAASKGKFVLAGTGLESTRETIRLTNKAATLGVQAALVLTPSFYIGQMTDEALIKHFSAVAEASAIPILIYNVPKFTHLNISVEAVKVLSQHPNIIGMKDSFGDVKQLEAFKRVVPKEFNPIVGTASVLYSALDLGICVGILALANCLPNECAEIQRLHDDGKLFAAKELQSRLLPVNKAVTDTYGIAGLKYASTLFGYEGGNARAPLMHLNEEEKTSLREILEDAELLTSPDRTETTSSISKRS